jgi:hypothetical protein
MRKPRVKCSTVPTPHHIDSRICFGIAYFTSEADATAYDAHVRAKGYTYNGGFFDGLACGRERTWDYERDGVKFYAVAE